MDTKNITFVLPDGLSLSGVVSWAVETCRRLNQTGHKAKLLRYANFSGLKTNSTLLATLPTIEAKDLPNPFWVCTEQDVIDHLAYYELALPTIIIPNWTHGTYASCALLSRDRAEEMRVLGFAHADEDDYYELLYYYEPLIHFFVAVSDEIAAKLRQGMPHRAQDVVVRPYAVNTSVNLERFYTASRQPLRLMYAGRLVEKQKRVSDLLRLAQLLIEAKIDFQLEIVGEGPSLPSLRRRLKELSPAIQQRVKLVGQLPIDRMAQTWRTADVCVLVSEYEGTSVSMLEAMAQGCVPVVTQVSGTAAVIRPEENGLVAPVNDLDAMVDHIQRLAADRDWLATLGQQAHQTILELFSYDRYIDWLVQTSAVLWKQPARPWPRERTILPREFFSSLLRQQAQQVSATTGLEKDQGWPPLNGIPCEVISQQIVWKKLVRAMGLKIAAKRGFSWLYHFGLRTVE